MHRLGRDKKVKMLAMNSVAISDWKIFVFGVVLLIAVSAINVKLPILPVSGLTFIVYSVLLWFVTVCVTFISLHKFLQRNEPVKFNIFCNISKLKPTPPKEKRELKVNSEGVKKLAHDIDLYFISKWYGNVSKDEEFVGQSKQFLEEVITRLIGIQLQVNNKVLLHAFLNIYLKHLKEFKRTLKRREKYNVSIEELYRYSHIANTNSTKPRDYFIHQLTINLLRHFINSELWNSLPCHILVSIIAKRLICYLLVLLSNPEFLNYHLLKSIISKQDKEKLDLDSYTRISITQYYDVVDGKKTLSVDSADAKDIENKNKDNLEVQKQDEAKPKTKDKVQSDTIFNDKLQEKSSEETEVVEESDQTEKPIEMKVAPTEKPPELRKRSDTVKIHEPKSSSRTWRDQRDLACVSLGQDPLDVLQSLEDVNIKPTKGAFWDTPVKADEVKEGSSSNAANMLFNEVKNITSMEGIKSSIKPISDATERTLHNIKDLQESTVNNALHKIGDFQDEAAGVVEGILDFGRAGLRKGLRLTGLQDNIENAKAISITHSKPPKKKLAKLTRSDSQERVSSIDSAENVWINPLQMDSPNSDDQILLEKEKPLKTESDDIQKTKKEEFALHSHSIPSIFTEPGTDSPDPEYEDAADLASSIAKLRSLLQQRSSESSLSTPAISPMPDEFQIIEVENVSDLDEADGVMPAFYKFCTKKATGVLHNTLNTIKTALPSNPMEQSTNVWKFKSELNESDTLSRMKKILSERKEYCTIDNEIDTAYEAIDSLDSFINSPNFAANLQFEDELDEFEAKVPITKSLIDIICELFSDTNSPFLQEPFVRGLILGFGNNIENFARSKIDDGMQYLVENLISIPAQSNTTTLNLEIEKYVELIVNNIPETTKFIFGKTNLTKAINLFVSSLQVQKINEDVLLQMFEILVLKLIEESSQTTPPASA